MDDGNAPLTIDLGTELGEGFALPPGGLPINVLSGLTLPGDGRGFHRRHLMARFDEEVLPVVSSAHLACGLHSGDPLVLHRTVAGLVGRGVQIGAHPSYPDVFNFGQNRIAMPHDELVAVLLYQFGALQGVLATFGETVRHVKCHGALAFDVANEGWACEAMIEAIRIFDPTMVLVAMAGTASVAQARAAGLRVVEEGFADRGYDAAGRLVPRDHPRALHDDPRNAARQVVAMARGAPFHAADGTEITLPSRSICLHADTPAAGDIARAIRDALTAEGIAVRPLAELAT